MAGYSGTPLIKKLGIKEDSSVVFLQEPKNFRKELGKLPKSIVPKTSITKEHNYIHLFTKSRSELEKYFPKLKKALNKTGSLWVSWPKKTSKIPCDFSENDLREIGLAAGLVDVKVAAIDQTWSGLKFVWRLKDR
jgi:hypothetical protein